MKNRRAARRPAPGPSAAGATSPIHRPQPGPGTWLASTLVLGSALGFWFWMLSAPEPAFTRYEKLPPPGLFDGLPVCLLAGMAVGGGFCAALASSGVARAWRARVAASSCWLFAAALSALAPGPAVHFELALAVVWLAVLSRRGRTPPMDGFTAVLGLGGFACAVCFFQQLRTY